MMDNNEINLLRNKLHILKIKRHDYLEISDRTKELQERIDNVNFEIETIELNLNNLNH